MKTRTLEHRLLGIIVCSLLMMCCFHTPARAFQGVSDPETQYSYEPFLTPGDPRLRYLRFLQLDGTAPTLPLTIQPVPTRLVRHLYTEGRWAGRFRHIIGKQTSGAIGWGLLPVQMSSIWNSDIPQGQNERGLWAGRGLSTRIDLGLYAQVKYLTIQLAPALYYSQNNDFDTVPVDKAGYSTFINTWHQGRIDMPQRFGTDPITNIGWGQSFASLELHGISLRYGTQNLWWGPARYNPIVISNNARGFPHLSVGSAEPFPFLLGDWQATMIWGGLTESEWFDDDPDNDGRFLTGLVMDFQPAVLPGLTIGGSRIYYQYVPEDGLGFSDYFVFFESLFKENVATPDNPAGNDRSDQMISLYARWVMPESGFELYGEWARNDHTWDLRDLLQQPDHSRAYTIGLLKKIPGKEADYYLGAEITQLGRSMTTLVRASPTYYEHHIVRQGYTHLGQVLGAGIGPGSESQRIELTRLAEWGSAELAYTRIRWDNDAYYANIENIDPRLMWYGNDVSNLLSLRADVFRNGVMLQPELTYTWQLNRNIEVGTDAHNLRLSLSILLLL